MSSVISGEYVTFKHIKTRKMVVLEIEVPEEKFQEVITKLGMPIGGESKPVAVALLDKTVVKESLIGEPTEGEKLRTRAVMLCKDEQFQYFTTSLLTHNSRAAYDNLMTKPETVAKELLCTKCEISSRSELATNIEAQTKFKELLERYKNWQFENQYNDNLNRF